MNQQLTQAPIGIDLGSYKSKVSVAKRGGVQIITNQANFRETPCVIGFGDNERQIGESGFIKMKSNFRNSVIYPLRFAGLSADYPLLRAETKFCPAKTNISSGRIKFDVRYQGQNQSFAAEQILAAYFNKLKNTIAINGFQNKEAVIAVPPYMTQAERKSVLLAARIAEINVTRLINESTAVALDYGMFRKNQLTADPRNVLFIDFGHSKLSLFCCSFTKQEMNILLQDFERSIGCRDLDFLMFEFYRQYFEKSSGGLDLSENRKAYIKLMQNIEKQRKVLSGNQQFEMNVQYLMEENDLHYSMNRNQFNNVSKPVFDKMTELLTLFREKLKEKGINIHSVELIGGGTRIPEFLRIAKEILGHEPSRTLNSSESIARGCGLMAAIKSPLFKVQNYTLNEKAMYGVKFYWNFVEGNNYLGPNAQLYPQKQGKMIFEAGCKIPSSKTVKFARKQAIQILVEYQPTVVGFKKQLGYYVTKPQNPKQQVFGVQFKLKLTEDGLVNFDDCSLVEQWTEQTKVPIKKDTKPAEKKPEGEKSEAEGQKKQEPPQQEFEIKKSKKQRFTKVDYKAETYDSYTPREIEQFFSQESTMMNQDRLIVETYQKKNQLESLLYSWKDRLTGAYSEYCAQGKAQEIIEYLMKEHDWLYNQGQESNRSTYNEKIEITRKKIKEVQEQYELHENFKKELQYFANNLKKNFEWLNSLDQKYKHIEPKQREPGFQKLEENKQWGADLEAKYNCTKKNEKPPISIDELKKKSSAFTEQVRKIMTKPVPKKEEPKKQEPKPQKMDEQNNPANPAPSDTKMDEQK